MNKEFLTDYEAKEKDEEKRFRQKFIQEKIGPVDRYPSTYRLKLNEPYTKSIDGERVWSQIPLYGTTIITLKPTRREIFEKVHGFDIEDIDRLIDFAKETGRIHFALEEYPTRYIKLDFLEPILKELKPPKLMNIPLDWVITKKEIQKLYGPMHARLEKFQSLDFIKNYIEKKYHESVISQDIVERGVIHDLIRLKLLGYESLIKDFMRLLTTVETSRIILLLGAIHGLFLHPYDPLKGIRSFKRQDIRELHEQFPSNSTTLYKGIQLSHDVGRFLNDKLKLIIPKNLDGAIELDDKYDLNDLRKVMVALDQAVKKEKIEVINEKTKEVTTIFENVWTDANKLTKKKNFIRHGLSFGVAVVGAVATLPIGGIGGLLAGLGFEVADTIADMYTYESISETIMKLKTQSYVAHVYDFKQKYKLL